MAALSAGLMHDRVTSHAWLTFACRPPFEVLDDMKAKGWRWSAYREAWNHPAMVTRNDPRIPAGVAVHHDGLCDYSGDRAERLDVRAEKAAEKGAARVGVARRILSVIPMGQPVLVGHHSEGRHRRDLARVDGNFRKGFGLLNYATTTKAKAEGSRKRQAGHENPLTARNRLARLVEQLAHAKSTGRADVVEVLDLLISDTLPAAERAIASDALEPLAGDIVWCGGLQLVLAVHEKTLHTASLSEGNAWGWEGKVDRRKLKKILSRGNPLPTWQASRMRPAAEGRGMEYCGHKEHKTRNAALKCLRATWPDTHRAYACASMIMPESLKEIVRGMIGSMKKDAEPARSVA